MAACLMNLAACSGNAGTVQQQGALATQSNANETTIYGKVTAVDGDKITLALGTMENDRSAGQSGGRPSGDMPSGDIPSGAKPSGDMPSVGAARSGGMPAGGGGFGELTLTGESKAIEITDTGILKKFDRGEMDNPDKSATASPDTSFSQGGAPSMNASSASLSDIEMGSILKVTYQTSDQKLLSVTIMGSGNSGQNSSSAPSSTDS